MNWLYVSWHAIERWMRTRKRERQMGRTEEGVNNEVREPERTRPRLPSLMRQEQVHRKILFLLFLLTLREDQCFLLLLLLPPCNQGGRHGAQSGSCIGWLAE